MLQVSVNLGIADHICKEKCVAIATTVDELGNKFKPELRAGCADWQVFCNEYEMAFLISEIMSGIGNNSDIM